MSNMKQRVSLETLALAIIRAHVHTAAAQREDMETNGICRVKEVLIFDAGAILFHHLCLKTFFPTKH